MNNEYRYGGSDWYDDYGQSSGLCDYPAPRKHVILPVKGDRLVSIDIDLADRLLDAGIIELATASDGTNYYKKA